MHPYFQVLRQMDDDMVPPEYWIDLLQMEGMADHEDERPDIRPIRQLVVPLHKDLLEVILALVAGELAVVVDQAQYDKIDHSEVLLEMVVPELQTLYHEAL